MKMTKYKRRAYKPWYIVLFVICVLVFSLFMSFNIRIEKPLVLTSPDGYKLQLSIEIADDREERKIGLMHRREMPQKAGMLLVWPEKMPIKMWMKNTYIPLDMLFIEDETVVGIIEGARPHDETLLGIHIPVNKVLEVNAGVVSTHNITVGWKVSY